MISQSPKNNKEMLRAVIGTFSQRVRARNREDCKQFINDFVDIIVVHKDKVGADLNAAPPDTEDQSPILSFHKIGIEPSHHC